MSMKYKKEFIFSLTIILTALLTYSATAYYYTDFNKEPKMNDGLGLSGHLDIFEVYHINTYLWNGYIDTIKIQRVNIDNVIVNNFLNIIREQIHNISAPDYKFNYVAIGNSSGGGASSTALVSEYNRTIGTYSEPSNYVARLTCTFTFGENANITESGCFNATSSGILMNYQDFAQISCTSATELEVRWSFTYQDA